MTNKPSVPFAEPPRAGGAAGPAGAGVGAATGVEPIPGTDRLAVRGIEVFAHHGVFDFERRDGQKFVVDLVLGLDTRSAAASDDLRDTVDYGTLVMNVKTAIETHPVDLVETLAQRIADICLTDGRVQWTEVTVHKPEAPIQAAFSDVALTIYRSRA